VAVGRRRLTPVRGVVKATEQATRRQGVLPTLSSWVRLVDSERWDEGDEHQNPPTQRTVEGECGWLTAALDWIEAQRWVDEFAKDLSDIMADMNHEMGVEPDSATRPTCTKCGWEMEGQGDYEKELHRYSWYRCIGCAHTITTAAELDRASRSAEDLVTLKYAAKVLEKPFSTLRRWKQAGWIAPRGNDQRGEIFSINAIRIVAQTVEPGKKRVA
jgi:hypothetical protein